MTSGISKLIFITAILLLCLSVKSNAQLVINEGSNKNFTTIADEDNEYNDWIELYNSGNTSVSLNNYSLTDDNSIPDKWVFPNISILPHTYKTIFCSGKNRKPISGFQQVLNTGSFTPVAGWNTHNFSTPFNWDGVSNLLINVCSYKNDGYTTNSIFNQSSTPYYSTVFSFVDLNDGACGHTNGTPVQQRPNIKLNGHQIGYGTINNSTTDYPAPYGNWYWSAKNQMIIPASEMIAAGLTAGIISSIAFDVASTDPTTYSYIDFSLKMVSEAQVTGTFTPLNLAQNLHTNFSLNSSGETVYLYSPTQQLISQLLVNCINVDNSIGCNPDASNTIVFFGTPTPTATNNSSTGYSNYLQQPLFSIPSGEFIGTQQIFITNPNTNPSEIRYTLDGSDPTLNSSLYSGGNITITTSSVLKARAFGNNMLPSPLKASSYLIGINHTTPVLSVITDNANLYGGSGIFDNWSFDWEKPAFAEYFNTDRSLIFSQNAGIQIDGGAGGSRSQPQHSFRLELNNSVLGGGAVAYPLIPDKPWRNKYSKIYLRNGSNQYLRYPYKDACGVKGLSKETKNYYSAYRPVSVYINGSYFGLYELREKFDEEYFKQAEGADSTDILSVSYWYGGVLRSVVGSVDSFYTAYNRFNALDVTSADYWDQADKYFDMEYYNDYIIAEAFIQNVDWPYNNIKIYRSNKSDFRYRFCVIDMELSLQPNGWSSAVDDPIAFLFANAGGYPYSNIWLKSIQNPKFKNYFINRFADILNTSYQPERLIAIEDSMYNEVLPEMPKEYNRWGDPNNISQQMNDLRDNHLTMQSEFSIRGQKVRDHIQSGFALADQVDVTLKSFPANAGKIKISTITPETLPWTGIYFNGNPVGLTAIANPGFQFSHWDSSGISRTEDTTRYINLNITNNATFTAVFEAIPAPVPVYPTTTSHFLVYPNPGNGNFNIYFNDVENGNYQINIINSLGQIVANDFTIVENRTQLKKMNLNKLPMGLYNINIINGKNQNNLKLIISNHK